MLSRFIFESLGGERDSDNRRLLKSFPVLGRQWESILPFGESIARSAREFLRGTENNDVTVAALAAVVVLEGLTARDALAAFLDIKAAAATSALPTGDDESDACDRVVAMVLSVSRTMRQINALFGPPPSLAHGSAEGGDDDDGDHASSNGAHAGLGLLGRFLHRAVAANRPDDSSKVPFVSQSMPSSVREFRPALAPGALDKVPREALQEACGVWFRALAPAVDEGVGGVLRRVTTVAGLVRIRDTVWDLLREECVLPCRMTACCIAQFCLSP